MTVVALALMISQLRKKDGNAVGCSPDGDHWMFADCGARFLIQFLHVFTTMQCAAMARVVFVKSIKKVQLTKSYSRAMTLTSPRRAAQNDGFEATGQ